MFHDHLSALFSVALRDAFSREGDEIVFEKPKYRDMGDLSCSLAMRLSKELQKNPLEIAQEILDYLPKSPLLQEVSIAVPGFINLRLSSEALANALMHLDPEQFLSPKTKKRMVLDFSHPNIAKPLHFGHFRSTVIGESLVRILRHAGHEVLADNFLGNWGTNFGKLIVALEKWGEEDRITAHPTEEFVRLYQKFHVEAEKDEGLEKEAAEVFRKMEQEQHEGYLQKWQWIVAITLEELRPFYEKMDCHFDVIRGEQFYEAFLSDTLLELEKSPLVMREEAGALVAHFSDIPSMILQKTDGATLYQTRDLARLRYYAEQGYILSLEVVSNEQSLHFQQIFALAKAMGWNIDGVHISFGMILGQDGKKFSTRKGNGIPLSEVLEKAVEKAREKLTDQEDTHLAEIIGIGALKFNDLGQSRQKDITFHWDRMLDFNGYSGPFLQYSTVRCKSVLEKAEGSSPQFHEFTESAERNLALLLLEFPNRVEQSANRYAPHILAEYLFEVSGTFNSFYAACPILKATSEIRETRLYLTQKTKAVLEKGLWLLGIRVPDRM